MKCIIEVFHHRKWHELAELESVGNDVSKGHRGPIHFIYDDGYALSHLGENDYRAASCLYPVDMDVHTTQPWPSFVLDILPAGAARRALIETLSLKDNDTADWTLLLEGATHPPGNLRVVPSSPPSSPQPSTEGPGFSRDQIGGRDPDFVEYACQHRAGVAGTSGAHGESPKFLLTEDSQGLLHADGVLPDHLACRHWLAKWPRGHRESDRRVLRNEAGYMAYARAVGLTVHRLPVFAQNTLFIERFDRCVTSEGVERHGLESLCSLVGVSEYGVRVSQQELMGALRRFSTAADADIIEWVKRDVVNVALGNTDNHARNHAVIKTADGAIRLSPLFDFAPMFLDDAGIPRCCRWRGAESMGFPTWPAVVELVEPLLADPTPLRPALGNLAKELHRAPEQLAGCGVDEDVIGRLTLRIDDVRRSLKEIGTPAKSKR